MAGYVVVDASVVVKWLVTEENTDEADALARYCSEQSIQMAAPYHMRIEATNALHKRLVRGEHPLETVVDGVESLLAMDIEIVDMGSLHVRAAQLAAQLRQGAVYDAHYLALAESLGCDLGTADHRFERADIEASFPVHWLGDFATN